MVKLKVQQLVASTTVTDASSVVIKVVPITSFQIAIVVSLAAAVTWLVEAMTKLAQLEVVQAFQERVAEAQGLVDTASWMELSEWKLMELAIDRGIPSQPMLVDHKSDFQRSGDTDIGLQNDVRALFRYNASRLGKHSQEEVILVHDAILRDDLRDEPNVYNDLLLACVGLEHIPAQTDLVKLKQRSIKERSRDQTSSVLLLLQ